MGYTLWPAHNEKERKSKYSQPVHDQSFGSSHSVPNGPNLISWSISESGTTWMGGFDQEILSCVRRGHHLGRGIMDNLFHLYTILYWLIFKKNSLQ